MSPDACLVISAISAVTVVLAYMQLRKLKAELARERAAARAAAAEATVSGSTARQLRDELTLMRAAKPLNVRDLVPELCDADTSAPSAGRVRLAFRAHVLFFNEAPAVLPFRQLLTSELPDDARHKMLCELYARAVFESAFAALFDGHDPETDAAVLRQVSESLGSLTALEVHRTVAARGVVLRAHADLLGTHSEAH